MSAGPAKTPTIRNRKATHDYEILDKLEAGIALTGSEVKSLRSGKASLDEAFAMVRENEIILREANIEPYPMAGYAQHKAKRERKLLLHKSEIRKLLGKVTQKGLTLIPLDMHFNERGLVKVVIALARGKKTHDKRADLKTREHKREMDRAMRRGK